MDEIERLSLHQWLCACRQLMLFEPAVGASAYDQVVGALTDLHEQYQPGWNRVIRRETAFERVVYVYIGPDRGLTTPMPPDGVDPASLPTVYATLPAPAESRLWRRTMELAEDVAALYLTDWPPSRVKRTMEFITSEVDRDPGTHDTDRMRQWGRRCLDQLTQARDRTRGEQILVGDFLQPARDIVHAFASFELTGSVAREVLALVLQVQCNLPSLAPPERTSPDARRAALEHVVNTADRLMLRRAHTQVTPYFELTYLAGLLAATAVALAAHSREFAPGYPQQQRLDDKAKYVEELGAYGVWPAFVLPAAYSPRETLEAVVARAALVEKPVNDMAEEYALHPALRAGLPELDPPTAVDERTALSEYQRRSAGLEQLDALALVDEDAGPVAVQNAEQITMHLLAFSFGSLR